jgi:hypothetical protein
LKKISSILLSAILLFNWLGYQLLTSLLEENSNRQLEKALDNNEYNESDLISIKIPVSYLPYYNNSSIFERVDGQVEIQGLEYKYVKRRIYQDSLELLCIPNPSVMKLKEAKNEFFRFVNDLQHNGNDKSGHSHHGSTKNFSVDCYMIIPPYRMNEFPPVSATLLFKYLFPDSSRYRSIPEIPPDNA